jgi:hypothetical protein
MIYAPGSDAIKDAWTEVSAGPAIIKRGYMAKVALTSLHRRSTSRQLTWGLCDPSLSFPTIGIRLLR